MTAGLAGAPLAAPPDALPVAAAALATICLTLARPGPGAGRGGAWVWLATLALASSLAGLATGSARLAAIDAGALRAAPGSAVELSGFVAGTPRRAGEKVRVPIETAAGRLLVESARPLPDLSSGTALRARGTIRDPDAWEEGYLRVRGIAQVLEANAVELTGGRRGGLPALTDSIRERAQSALDRGMGEREAALARGFVLGEDDRIDPSTTTDFRRSGLAHLLAVSGQNVLLLALLATPLLAVLGLSLRARLLATLGLIALYVPVAGAGPSIQRAGVMGAAGVVAALSGRPRVRWYVVLLAAAATLGANPRASADVGWQLSFAAVAGILLWSPALGKVVLRLVSRPRREGSRRALPAVGQAVAEGAGMTIAATVATAPLAAHHFEAVPLAALPANLLALPAVAPVMWLGMLVAMAGQLGTVPVEPLNWVAAPLIGYIAQIAHWLGEPGWATAPVSLSSPLALAATYAALLGAGLLLAAHVRRNRGLAIRRPQAPRSRRLPPSPLRLASLTVALAAVAISVGPPAGDGDHPPVGPRFALTAFDVGQGDAILLEPSDGEPVLVDTGAAGAGIGEALDEEGVGALGALVLTHDQADHAGGATELLGQRPVRALAHAGIRGELLAEARTAGARPIRLASGHSLRSGSLRLEALWPPPELAPERSGSGDPNDRSLVLLARWRGFSALLTGDAEAEAVPLAPPPVDVLKVAHHGSEDAGLVHLLERVSPRLALISVGENGYGHPASATLTALERGGVPVLRTDLEGDIRIEAGPTGWAVER